MSTTSRAWLAAWMAAAACCAPAVAAPDASGATPGDAAMTCEQIAAELAPYAQQMVPNLQALGASQQQQMAQAQETSARRQREHMLLMPLATAGGLDPTGASKRAYVAAEMAQTAKEQAENQAAANSPLAKQSRAQSEQLAAQGQQMQSNARIQRLMQLGQQKGCTRKK